LQSWGAGDMNLRAWSAGAAFACFATFATAQINSTLSLYAKPARMVSLPDGRRMNLRCAGSGSPTIVLEAGLGKDASTAWSRVYPKLSSFARVCSYDRAGLMYSDPGPLPRTSNLIVSDLHDLLKAAGEKGPFVLVGHSLGGAYVRAYAAQFPTEAVALVLIEGSVEGQWAALGPTGVQLLQSAETNLSKCLAAAEAHEIKPAGDCLTRPPAFPDDLWASMVTIDKRPAIWRTMLSEAQSFSALPALPEDGSHFFGDRPLRVLYVSHPEFGLAGDKAWAGMMRQIADLSTRGRLELVPNSSHNVPIDQPDAVAEAIHEVWKQVSR
jgi:pimeloyl-ACP methyl ester carboxylesterase